MSAADPVSLPLAGYMETEDIACALRAFAAKQKPASEEN